MTGPSPHTDPIFNQMTAQSQTVPLPPPRKRFVSGFATHSDDVMTLPLKEHILLRVLVDWVMTTNEMPHAPVVKISFIGHTDRDDRVGREFENQLSLRRALAVQQFFIKQLFLLTPLGFISVAKQITFPPPTGVGSAEFKPASNEAGRLLNRRVTMIFEHGRPPPPPPPFILDLKVRVDPPIGPPRPEPHPWTRPIPPPIKMPPSKFQETIKKVRKALEHFDKGTIAKGMFEAVKDFIEPMSPEERRKAEIEVAEAMRDDQEEEDRERRKRTLDPPGDKDPDEEN